MAACATLRTRPAWGPAWERSHQARRSARAVNSGRSSAVAVKAETTIDPRALEAALGDRIVSKEAPLTELRVEGSVPEWLSGSLYRTGPGVYKDLVHYFDGCALLVMFKFQEGKVFWGQRYVDSDAYKGWKASGKPVFSEFAYRVSPVSTLLAMLRSAFGAGIAFTDNASITLQPSVKEGQVIASTETIVGQYRIERDSLQTQGRVLYDDDVRGEITTAHPGRSGDGWSINVATGVWQQQYDVYRYHIGEGRRELLHRVKPSNGRLSYIHDLAVSDHYVALVEQPIYANWGSLMGLATPEYVFADWEPRNGTVVRLLPLDGSPVTRTFKLPPFFAFHYANTFEKDVDGLGRSVVIDVPWSCDPSSINELLLKNMRNVNGNLPDAVWKRIILPLEGPPEALVEDLVSDHKTYGSYAELPCINPDYSRRDYRYIYCGSAAERPSPVINTVSKLDIDSKKIAASWRPVGGVPLCEPKFVPRPGGSAEDDGVVLAPAMDAMGKSFLAVLAAEDLRELARCYTLEAFPMGFHTTFIRTQ